MARKATVPIDMASEQKSILGIISKRQLIYIVVGGSLIYSYTPFVFKLTPTFYIGAFLCLFTALPVAALVGMFGFMKKQKYNLNYDHYLIIKMGYKNRIGVWRKGARTEDRRDIYG